MRGSRGVSRWTLATLAAAAGFACSEPRHELSAQMNPSAAEAAETITPGDLRMHIGVLAHDSMRGRDTPSPELEKTARYVADRFRALGLLPAAGDSYLQPYPLTVVRPGLATAQRLALRGPDGRERAVAPEEFVAVPAGEALEARGALAVLRSLDSGADVDGRVALVGVERSEMRGALTRVRALLERGAAGAILVVEGGADYFGGLRRFFERPALSLGEPDPLDAPIVLVTRETLPEPLRDALAGGPAPSGWQARLRADAEVRRAEAWNTIGWIEGSDPELRNEYVILTAHMDHVGVGRPVDGDSIYNGADDDASGTSAVLEAAEAFASLPTPPRRSVVFMTVSGEEKGLFGSRWYVENPSFPLEATVANLNIDMIGRNWRDTVVVIGKEESTLGRTVERIAGERPELDLSVIDDPWPEERFYFRSDHYNFARKGVPILFFFTGTHDDYHRPSDEPDRILYEKTSRIARLVFWLALDVADAPARPQWDPDAYARVVEEGRR